MDYPTVSICSCFYANCHLTYFCVETKDGACTDGRNASVQPIRVENLAINALSVLTNFILTWLNLRNFTNVYSLSTAECHRYGTDKIFGEGHVKDYLLQ